jgi:NADPH:quinone reductase-like Zn-dependent oxidoreductase
MHVPEFGSEFLLGGVDVVFECTGGATGLDTALRLTRAGGTVVVSGMPSGSVDLTPLWFRELTLVGAYASGQADAETRVGDDDAQADAESRSRDAGRGVVGRKKASEERASLGRDRRPEIDGSPTDFSTAMSLAASAPLDDWVEPPYPLRRWREALAHAIDAGKLGSVKIAFAPGKD